MRRIGCLILSIIVLASFAMVHAESSDLIEFEPRITKTVHLSSDEFMSTGFLRANVTVFLIFDMIWNGVSDANTPDLSQSTFVGRSNDLLYVYAHTNDNNSVCIGYLPSEESAIYTFSGSLSDSAIEKAMSEMCLNGYYKNEMDDIYDVMNELNKMMNN